ncbi:hypothetical protein ACFOD9_01435 [Novosphingobium bradum]|uniref:Uncharacterized protein n=1 Tax=Novosphingobium bradum TaxID=1737444 RepID=A0ABV7ILT4_9SPHN
MDGHHKFSIDTDDDPVDAPWGEESPTLPPPGHDEDGRPLRGILIGLPIAALIWAAAFLILRLVL